jgi:tetratricopeptide (TPR) repeat protein
MQYLCEFEMARVKMDVQDMRSQEFKVTVEKTLEGIEYPVYASSPVGSTTGAFVLPFSVDQIEQALQNFCKGIPSGRYRRGGREEIQFDEPSPEGFGRALFQALFRGEVLALYRESFMAREPDVAMPVKLNIMARGLARLPWELLYDPERNEFLSFVKDTPVIRFVDGEPRPHAFDPPLRILLVSAKPAGTELDPEPERKVVEEALDILKREDRVRIDHLFGATIPELRKKIREHGPHIVHFMGHGQVNHLLLDDRERKDSFLVENSLGTILCNASSLRMVVLNACETARPTDSEARLELAYGLAQRGMLAIVDMQFKISAEASYEFAGELYQALAEGCGVVEAVLRGQTAVQNRFVDDIEWVPPVLYMQVRGGQIFDDLLREKEKWEVEPSLIDRVELCYEQGLQYFDRGDWFPAFTFLKEVQRLAPGYKDVQLLTETARDELTKQETERRAQEKLAALYRQALLHCDKERWQAALDLFNEILDIAPSYKDVQVQAEEARRVYEQQLAEKGTRLHLEALYQRAQEYLVIEDWGRAIGLLEQAVELDRNYEDAAARLAKAQLQKWLADTYAEAEKLVEAEQWEDAATVFQQILEKAPYYRQASTLLAEAQRQHRLAMRYTAASQACEEGRWTEAIQQFQQIITEDAGYWDVKERLAEARRQQELREQYEQGMACFGRGDWKGAISALGVVVKKDPNYEDAFVKLSEARRQQELASHYAEGERYMTDEHWDEAIAAFEKVVYINSQYRDVKGRLKEANGQKRLAELYAAGQENLVDERWEQAIEYFRQVLAIDETYKDISEKLRQAEHEYHLEDLYHRGQRFYETKKWSKALELWSELAALEPNYLDVAVKVKEVEQQKRLEDTYADGVASLDMEAWAQAVTAFEKIIEMDADYRDTRDLLRKAEQGRWADWKSRMWSSLQDSGNLTANSLDYVPERLRLDTMRNFYEEYSKSLELVPSTDFQVLTLSDFDLVSALRKTWRAMMRASQSEQIELSGSEPAESFDILADELTDQLCSALGFVRAPDRDRKHKQLYAQMIRTPTLHYKLPSRFPLVIFAKRFVEAADVRDLLDLMRILERPIGFAFLMTLGDADKLKTLLDREVFEHDFVVLSRHDLERILLSRDKAAQLTQTILEQVSLTVISPYRVAGPVPESMFFGRETEIRTIRDAIRDTNVAVTGGRRIGKTSILRKVQRILKTQLDCETLFLDCHAVDTPEIFNREFTEKLSGQLELPTTFSRAIETARVVEDKLIIVLLDEVDDLLQYDVEQQGERLFKEFRSLSQEGYCNFIFCGGKTLYERIHNPDSPFFNFCHNVVLRFLSRESAARIIIQPMSDMGIELKGRDELIGRILGVSSCHPNIVQLICNKLVENIKERTISLKDLDAVITREDFYMAFKEIAWGQATPLEKVVSLAFVEEESFTAGEAYQRLAEFGIEDRDAIDEALDTLELYSLIIKLGKRYEYALREFPHIVKETEDINILIDSFARRLKEEA